MFDDDSKLLRRLRAGDRDAYAQVGWQYHREIWAYLYRLTRDYDRAEDLAQEVALRFWQHAPGFKKVSSLRAWLYKVAYHLFIDHRKSATPESVELQEDIQAAPEGWNPDTLLDRQILNEQIEAALDQLPEEQRQAVILTKIQGLKFKEAAEALQLPLGTVQWQVHQGLKKLRLILLKEASDYVSNQK